MGNIFQEIEINGMVLKNRLVRSATWEGMCDPDGRPTKKLHDFYRTLAEGGVGLIITGYTYVSKEGKQSPGKMGLYNDDFADEMKSLTEAVHDAGGKICIQLVHAGGQAIPEISGLKATAPSAIKIDQYLGQPDELSVDEIKSLVQAFGTGASLAKEYGFDAVQLHGAHGYLINQFLSPLANRRSDDYGGSIENRCRFLMEVYKSVREAVGDNYPVLIKMNGSDFLEGGLNTEDALLAAKKLDEAGIDAIEVSGGTAASGKNSPARTKIDSPEKEGYNLSQAKLFRDSVKCPIISVGGFRSFSFIADTLKNETADCISMARPLIREPDLPKRWESGGREPAACISCNGCFGPGRKEGGIRCVQEQADD